MNKQSLVAAAKRYAAADKSDPFAFARAMSHSANGIASYANKNGQSAIYDAELYYEPREIKMPDGKTLSWQAGCYRNIIRP